MRRTRPWVVASRSQPGCVCLVAPALAKDPLLAGGGGGGVCYGPPPELDAGWVAVGDNCFAPTRHSRSPPGDAVRWSLEGQIASHRHVRWRPDAGTLTGDGFAVQFNAPGHLPLPLHDPPGHGRLDRGGRPRPSAARPLEVLDGVGRPVVEPVAGAGGRPVLRDSVPMRVEFSPLAAVVVLAVGLPLSLGLAHAARRLRAGARRLPPAPRRGSRRRAQRPPARR